MADQDGQFSKMMTYFPRHVTPSIHFAKVKGNSFHRSCNALEALKRRGEGGRTRLRGEKSPWLNRVQLVGLDVKYHYSAFVIYTVFFSFIVFILHSIYICIK